MLKIQGPGSLVGQVVLALLLCATIGVQGMFLPRLVDEKDNTVTGLETVISFTCYFELQHPQQPYTFRDHKVEMPVASIIAFFQRSWDEKNNIHRYCDDSGNLGYGCALYYSPDVSKLNIPPVKPAMIIIHPTKINNDRSWNYYFRNIRTQTTDPADKGGPGDVESGTHECDWNMKQ